MEPQITQRALVSACLLSQPVRYDGGMVVTEGGILTRWQMEGRIVSICPGMVGGLSVPRLPAEIHGEGGGAAVLRGAARVVEHHGHDVTEAFPRGAQRVLEAAQAAGVQVTVFTERSPSCGFAFLYGGTFSSQPQQGEGVTAALLRRYGIRVFSQHQLEEAERLLDSPDALDRVGSSIGKPQWQGELHGLTVLLHDTVVLNKEWMLQRFFHVQHGRDTAIGIDKTHGPFCLRGSPEQRNQSVANGVRLFAAYVLAE